MIGVPSGLRDVDLSAAGASVRRSLSVEIRRGRRARIGVEVERRRVHPTGGRVFERPGLLRGRLGRCPALEPLELVAVLARPSRSQSFSAARAAGGRRAIVAPHRTAAAGVAPLAGGLVDALIVGGSRGRRRRGRARTHGRTPPSREGSVLLVTGSTASPSPFCAVGHAPDPRAAPRCGPIRTLGSPTRVDAWVREPTRGATGVVPAHPRFSVRDLPGPAPLKTK